MQNNHSLPIEKIKIVDEFRLCASLYFKTHQGHGNSANHVEK